MSLSYLYKNFVTKKWPSDKANRTCENIAINYCMLFKELKVFLTSWPQLIYKFLIAPTYLFAMLLLIGLTPLCAQGVFVWYITIFDHFIVEAYKQMLL